MESAMTHKLQNCDPKTNNEEVKEDMDKIKTDSQLCMACTRVSMRQCTSIFSFRLRQFLKELGSKTMKSN